jgi:hypothetical protein
MDPNAWYSTTRHDSGEPTRHPDNAPAFMGLDGRREFAFVEELIAKLAAAEWRAVQAEESAKFYAACAILFLVGGATIICIMAAT